MSDCPKIPFIVQRRGGGVDWTKNLKVNVTFVMPVKKAFDHKGDQRYVQDSPKVQQHETV